LRRAALLLLGAAALLLSPGAPGLPDVPGDPTPPSVTPVINGTLGAAGWYTSSVTVNWSIVDPESLILSTSGCDARTLNADTLGTRLTCTATSDGGETTVSKTFKIDKTAPAATPSPSRGADVNGWYNHGFSVGFVGDDGTSGLESCSGVQSYEGPDTASASLSGTCRDVAGNVVPVSFAFKYDETAPQASPAARPPDANGWYNHTLTVTYQGADGTSGVGSCTETTYSGPDDPSVALAGTCVDRAGNESGASVLALKYDETAPQAAASASRAPDVNGWYNHAVTVNFAGDDATSGLDSCDPPATYAGPDAATTSVSGACRDRAGNVAPRAYAFKYDATAPQATATPSRQPNANGWYRAPLTVSFAATDAVSGTASCAAAKSYGGPDAASAVVTGTCVDTAGNTGTATLPLKYDATAPAASATPARQPNANGWYKAPLSVTFAGTDGTSGIESCDAAQTYTGPDTASATMSGACRDKAGNSTGASFGLKYDATAPQVTAAPGRAANANGWYNAPLSVSFTGGDATSGVDSCESAKTYSGPDSTAASVTGNCLDRAGNSGSASLPLKYDATAPQTTATPSRQANPNGWHNAALSVTFAATDATAGVDTCDPAKSYSGPDTTSTTLAGTCTDKAGNAAGASLPLKYDATAPQATATPSRQPNGNGWYNAPLTVSFAATDATSGLDSCPAAKTYSGPDQGAAAVSGTCVDKAGNGGLASLPLRYDATAPQASATPSRQPNANGWYNAPLTVSFAATDATSGLDSCPAAKTYSGPDDGAAAVSGTCVDKAGNGGPASLPLKYDATAPQSTATPSRHPNANGWYNAALTVTFAATDAMSTVASCDAARSYSGPDAASASVAGNCVDKAGNTGGASFPLRYDATAPQAASTPARMPDRNGWYNAPLAVTYSATDALSGVQGCDPQESYSSPDSATASLTGTCLDKAGNVTGTSFGFKFDSTAPQATATPSRTPDTNGWFNHTLTVTFAATDATAGLEGCEPAKSYAGPDSAAATVAGACSDKAGNVDSAVLPLKYDATAPQVGAAASRPPNANGWYKAPLSVSFSGTDGTAGIDSCDGQKAYSGPDNAAATVTGSCRDKAGNSAGTSFALKYDATAPQVTATPGRAANANGWYNAPLAVTFTGGDATSLIDSCEAAKTYSGPDNAAATVGGSCLDRAGNNGSASFPLKYDATAPQATATPSRAPNANGWYKAAVDVSFAATDALSGLESCPQAQTYAGPDTQLGVVSGTCVDKAGNGAPASLALRYDATAPSATASARAPDGNGWYRKPLTIGFGGADATSGVDVCTASRDYAGPDTTSGSASGSCRDRAGNQSGVATFGFSYDATAPQVTDAAPTRPPDRLDWYNRPIAFAFQGVDETSGVEACDPVTYRGPDSGAAEVTGTCVDRAGNSGARSFSLRYDGTGPEASAVASRAPDTSDWYRLPVTVAFTGQDAVSGLESCDPPTEYGGPDSALAVLAGVCVDRAGNGSVAAFAMHFDATAPQVDAVTPERAPDAAGWYNRRLAVAFHGTDATSGVEACTQTTYAGPDTGGTALEGSCRDHAGNVSAAASFALRYDGTAPSIGTVSAKAGNRVVSLSWTASADATSVEVRRGERLVYEGSAASFTDTGLENGTRYSYTLSAYDEARNTATATVTARPTAPLVSPAAGAKVSAPPLLVWTAVPNATYYNVQLWRRGRVLSAWPARTSFRLRRIWTYKGRRHRLLPGRYRWYVWPGYGRRPARKFGPLLGSSSFVVR
jgi:large repetitive protein